MNKKGQSVHLLIIMGWFFLLFLITAVVIALFSGVLTFTSDTITDAVSDFGTIGESNLTEITDMTIVPVNDSIQMIKWFSGFFLVICFIGLLMFAASIRFNPEGYLLGFYFLLVVILVMCAIYISNIYEEFYQGGDDIALELQEMPVASFLILYMPHIITFIAFIGGIIIFSGLGDGV